jgi:DNA-binding IclR family transcriptional regulator
MEKMSSYKRIEAVSKTIQILEFLATQGEPATGPEIAGSVEIALGTVMCHLVTLEEAGFVQQVGGAYRLGMKLAIYWARVKSNIEGEIARKRQDLDSISITRSN